MQIEEKRESVIYVVIVFIATYACWGTLALLGIPAKQNALSTILYLLGAFSTTITALLIPLLARKRDRGAYYKRFFRFKIAWKWYLLPTISIALITAISYLVMRLWFNPAAASLEIQPLYMIFPLFIFMIGGGGLEELGWRGILVHNLRKVNPILTAVGVGVIWACWHIPLFFIEGVNQYHNFFIPFLINCVALSFITTTIYLRSGSVIPCVAAHAGFNAFVDLGFWYYDSLIPGMVNAVVWLIFSMVFFVLFRGKGYAAAMGSQPIVTES